MEKLKLKVCGMRQSKNILEVAKLEPNFMGFIFYEKSQRHAKDVLEVSIFDNLPLYIAKVGVFVDATKGYILHTSSKFSFDYLQLHGNETPEYCQDLKRYGFLLIKAFSVDNDFNFEKLRPYLPFVDYFLFDTKAALPGGNGTKFDWNILKNYTLQKPFLLSGGIETADLQAILHLKSTIPQLFAIDVNSKFEIEPGLKDIEKLNALCMAIAS